MSPLNQLEKYEIDVQALMRGLVHELRNPLAAILTATSLLQDGEVDEESAMLLEVVRKESVRMNRILTEFSQFAKPSAPNVEIFDIARLSREVAAEMERDGVLANNVTWADELGDALPVAGDPHQVTLALRNIIENAAEALGERGGTVTLRTINCPPDACVVVEDTGKGLPDAQISQVFQPFYSTKPTSTGLGLPIARMALRASGGDVLLENIREEAEVERSKPSKGTRVTLRLPAGTG